MNLRNLIGSVTQILAKENMDTGIQDTLRFGEDSAITIFRVAIAIGIGVILASIWSIYDKKYLGGLVRKMIDEGCTSKENAKTLYELGYDDKLGVRDALRRGYAYTNWIYCVEEEEYLAQENKRREEFDEAHKDEKRPPKFKEVPFKPDLDTMRYYIPENRVFDASRKFSAKGSNWIGVCIVLFFVAVVLLFAIFALPYILQLANSVMGSGK